LFETPTDGESIAASRRRRWLRVKRVWGRNLAPLQGWVPHPAIRRTVKLSLRSRELDCRDHGGPDAPLVLDRKELLVGQDYPGREKFARFTQQEESHGLLDGLTDLSTLRDWELKFEQAGLQLRGYRLLWKPGVGRRRRCPASVVRGSPDPAPMVTERSHDSGRPAVGGFGEVGRPTPSVLPTRSRQFGIGKEIGGAIYVHRQYEDRLGPIVARAKRWLPACFAYDVVKHNRRTASVSFIRCPGFDVEPEPSIDELIIVRADGTL